MPNDTPNTSVSTGLSAMIQAHQSGQDLRTAFNSPDTVKTPPVTPVNAEVSSEEPEQENEPAIVSASDKSQDKEVTADSEEPAKTAESSEDIEEITFTDHKGRRTVKVDFSDRDKLKKIASLAYGSRKFQVERDQFKADLEKERAEVKALKADMTKFESIYEKEGLKGLAMMLEGPEGVKKLIQEVTAEEERWNDLTPAERNAEIRAREAEAKAKSESESKAEYERRLAELDKRQREADEKAFESKLNPAFDRYRFAGKLNDPVAEHRLDKAMWADVMEALQPYEDKGLEITQAMIDKEFRKARQEWDKTVNKQVDKKTKTAIAKTKVAAGSKAQAKVTQGMQTNAAAEQFKTDMNSGNVRDALRSFLSGNVKLTK